MCACFWSLPNPLDRRQDVSTQGGKGAVLNSSYSSFLARLEHVNPQRGSSQCSDCVNVCVCKRWRPYVCMEHITHICGKYRHKGACRKAGMRSCKLAVPLPAPVGTCKRDLCLQCRPLTPLLKCKVNLRRNRIL